jgi:hydrogenase maturation protease
MDVAPNPSRILIVGYGNTLRGDDGVGPRAAELLADDPRLVAAEVLQRHQLTPELATDIAEAALVVLVDASETGRPGEITVRRLDGPSAGRVATAGPGSQAAGVAGGSAWTHQVDAESLLALARELWGATPAAFVVGVGVESMELGDELSPAVELALPAVVDAVARIVAEHRPG